MNDAGRGFSVVSHAAEGAPSDWMRVRARRLLGADADGAIEQLALSGAIVVVDDDRVAGARLHRIETRLAERIRELLEAPPVITSHPPPPSRGPEADAASCTRDPESHGRTPPAAPRQGSPHARIRRPP